MREGSTMNLSEFLADLYSVVTGPSRRFSIIRERGALWGSVLLLVIPAYLAFSWVGGVYFNRDPLPGYSFILPAIVGGCLVLVKLLLLHLPARMIQGRGSYRRGKGSFRELCCLFGYTTLPELLGSTIAFTLFFTVPAEVGALFHDYRIAAISVLVALGISLFVWNVILTVLAMRIVYPMRDWKVVVAFVVGTGLAVGITLPTSRLAVGQADVDIVYLAPILTDRILRFHFAGPRSPEGQEAKMAIHSDRLAYRFGVPRRLDLLVFEASADYGRDTREGGAGAPGAARVKRSGKPARLVGRVLGLPGEVVQMSDGEVTVDGRRVAEPYLLAEHRGRATLGLRRLGRDEYLVLPESRELVSAYPGEWGVPRRRILGRMVLDKWPLGWIAVREHIFRAKPQR